MKAVKEESLSIIMFAFVLKELPLLTIQAGESFLIHHFDPFCMACKKILGEHTLIAVYIATHLAIYFVVLLRDCLLIHIPQDILFVFFFQKIGLYDLPPFMFLKFRQNN
jgi:hypothetical protein